MKRTFQSQVVGWMRNAFGYGDADDLQMRQLRFMEEALELVQSSGMSRDNVLFMVDYVFKRPKGSPTQEIGGVMVTLAGMAHALDTDMEQCAKAELQRIERNVDEIRKRHAAKPRPNGGTV